MLKVYRTVKEVPENIKIVKDNDAYFDAKSKLLNTDLVKKILLDIDEAGYVSETTFSSRNAKVGNLNKINLSTGTKTLINIINFGDICFDVLECGTNVLDLLPYVSSKVNGCILWKNCIYPFADNLDCDIMYKGKSYTKTFDFMRDLMEDDL